jgi:hypothetical protein
MANSLHDMVRRRLLGEPLRGDDCLIVGHVGTGGVAAFDMETGFLRFDEKADNERLDLPPA